jgi:hypothetical protein
MPSKANRYGRFKTHFTCVLTPTEEIRQVFNLYANGSQHTEQVKSTIAEVKKWVEKQVSNVDKPDYLLIFSNFFWPQKFTFWPQPIFYPLFRHEDSRIRKNRPSKLHNRI